MFRFATHSVLIYWLWSFGNVKDPVQAVKYTVSGFITFIRRSNVFRKACYCRWKFLTELKIGLWNFTQRKVSLLLCCRIGLHQLCTHFYICYVGYKGISVELDAKWISVWWNGVYTYKVWSNKSNILYMLKHFRSFYNKIQWNETFLELEKKLCNHYGVLCLCVWLVATSDELLFIMWLSFFITCVFKVELSVLFIYFKKDLTLYNKPP